jgi:hypothetical protein
MGRSLEQIDIDLNALAGEVGKLNDNVFYGVKNGPAVAATPSLDVRWFTPMTSEERTAFAAANPMDGNNVPVYIGGGELALQRARFGWSERGQFAPSTTAAAFVKNAVIAAGPSYVGQELDAWLNLTNRPDEHPTDATTIDGWLAFNEGVQAGPSIGGPKA